MLNANMLPLPTYTHITIHDKFNLKIFSSKKNICNDRCCTVLVHECSRYTSVWTCIMRAETDRFASTIPTQITRIWCCKMLSTLRCAVPYTSSWNSIFGWILSVKLFKSEDLPMIKLIFEEKNRVTSRLKYYSIQKDFFRGLRIGSVLMHC